MTRKKSAGSAEDNGIATLKEQLEEYQYMLQSILDTSLIEIAVLKAVRDENNTIRDFKILLINKALENETGRTDLAGKLYGEAYPGIKEIGLLDLMTSVVETGTPVQREYFYPEGGANRWFTSMFVKMDDGLVISNLNVTERKLAEQEQVKNYTLLQQNETLSGAGSWEYDIVTKEFLWSDGMYKLFNLPKGTPVTPSVYLNYVTEEDRHIGEMLVDAIQKDFFTLNVSLRLKTNGIVKTVKIKAEPLKNGNGEVHKMLGVDMDNTSAQEAEDKINQLNKTLIAKNRELESINEEIMTFSNIAATDYKDTLRQLYTNLEFIVSHDAKNLSDAGKANIRRAQSGIQKMKLLTDDIVSFLKIKSLDTTLTEVNLNEVIKTVLADLGEKAAIPHAHIICDTLPSINGYPLLLTLLFYHLLDNAIKFRNEDNDLIINITHSLVNQSRVDKDLPYTSYHKITVSDNGIGFNVESAEKMFTMFQRLHDKTKYKGSGIGLAICRKVMTIHSGLITAESSPGKGSGFICYFPEHLVPLL